MTASKPFPADNEQPDEEKMRTYHAKYISYSRAVGVMWGVLSVCFTIILIVCFVQSAWIETSDEAKTTAYFGLWKYAIADPVEGRMEEYGGFLDFGATPAADQFRTAAILIGVSIVFAAISVLCQGLFVCCSSNVVFMACGWCMAANTVVIGLACVMVPGGWASPTISAVCGSAAWDTGVCDIGKSYLLACIAGIDAAILSVLSFILAYRQVTLLPWEDEVPEEENKA